MGCFDYPKRLNAGVPCYSWLRTVKTNLTKRRFKAPKRSSCGLCKPHKRGWDDKKTPSELRTAVKHAEELREQGFSG